MKDRRPGGRPRRAVLHGFGAAALSGILAGCATLRDEDIRVQDDEGDDTDDDGDDELIDDADDDDTVEPIIPADTEIAMHPSPFSDMLADLGRQPEAWADVRAEVRPNRVAHARSVSRLYDQRRRELL